MGKAKQNCPGPELPTSALCTTISYNILISVSSDGGGDLENSALAQCEIFLICNFRFLSYLFIAYPGSIVLEEYQEHFYFQVTEVQIVTVEQIQKQFDGIL